MTEGNKKQIAPVNFREDSLSASGSAIYDLDANDLADDNGQIVDKLAPFRNLVIYNDGTTLLKLFVNNRKGYKSVPAGTIYAHEDDTINFIRVVNASTTTDGSFFLDLDSEETQKSLLKGILINQLRRKF